MMSQRLNESLDQISRRLARLTVCLMVFLQSVNVTQAGDLTGKEIYDAKCVSCHGSSGQGTKEYPRALEGTRTVVQLAKLIAKTMPEDDPGTCVGPDAEQVAAYIHQAFYVKQGKAPRIELSRLTVRQYRQAITDLVGSFRSEPGTWNQERGLKATYYKSRRMQEKEKGIERIDPELKFDFGVLGPDPETFPYDQFAIAWNGSVIAPETGEYEFIVNTDHGFKLWVNDNKKPLIDATVQSGADTEYRGSAYLLSGRSYLVRMEWTKAKQGVDDSKKIMGPPRPAHASIDLSWKPPHRPVEVIPQRQLLPRWSPEAFVVSTPFPPDDRSVGYERGTSVSKAWDQATTDAAVETTAYIASHLQELAGTRDDSGKLREFSRKFVERAFRRPLTDDLKKMHIDDQFDQAKNPEVAVKRVLLLALKSPWFLYREINAEPDGYDVASRISFALWDSIPDRELLQAAGAGQLTTREQVTRQAERMVTDPRTKAKSRAFFMHWLKVDQVPDLRKDPARFADFNDAVIADLRTSLELFLDDVLWGETSDFRALLTSDELMLNGRLAKFYGANLGADAPFTKVKYEPKWRAGVLSHPYLMASFAYTATSSPIHRGVFISRSVLGRSLKPPPEAVAPLAPDLHASLSTRERTALQTSPSACMTCHGMINPLGFGLENFDAVGRYRSEEKGKSIDASGLYEAPGGESHSYQGARELGLLLANSDETHEAFVEQLFHNLIQQPIRAFGTSELSELHRSFVKNQFHIRKLMVEIVASTALAARPAP